MKLPDFFGLDLSFKSAKLAQINGETDGKYLLSNVGQGELDRPITDLKDENTKKAFAENIKVIRDSAGITTKKAVVSLPESTIFSKVIAVPDLPEEQLEKVIFFEARNHLPVPPEEVQLDYIPIAKKTLDDGRKIQQILLIAAPKTLVNTYLEVLASAGIEVLALETESLASARTMTLAGELKQGTLVVDFGAQGIAVSVLKGKDMVFSQNISTGSDALTAAIAKDYNLDLRQAEQYKRTYGLLENQLEGRIAKSIMPMMQIINNELNKTINFIRINLADFAPTEVVLTGDGALLPGLATFLSLNLGLPVRLFDPASALALSQSVQADIEKYNLIGFTVAIGLALKSE